MFLKPVRIKKISSVLKIQLIERICLHCQTKRNFLNCKGQKACMFLILKKRLWTIKELPPILDLTKNQMRSVRFISIDKIKKMFRSRERHWILLKESENLIQLVKILLHPRFRQLTHCMKQQKIRRLVHWQKRTRVVCCLKQLYKLLTRKKHSVTLIVQQVDRIQLESWRKNCLEWKK